MEVMADVDDKMAGLLAKHSDAVVIGLGLTGYSVVRYLVGAGLQVKVIDTRSVAPFGEQLQQAFPDVPVYMGAMDESLPSRILRDASLVIVSPGVSTRLPELSAARERGADVVGDIELFVQKNQQPVVAITGSNGKSTVTSLVGEILRSAGREPLVGGNIGLPVLDALTDGQGYASAVLELSSFQLETTHSLAARVAVLLNVSYDHMDRYRDLEDYLEAKLTILDECDLAVLNRDDQRVLQGGTLRLKGSSEKLVSFGLDSPGTGSDFGVSQVDGADCLVRGSDVLMPVSECRMPGRHNVQNILAAWAATSAMDVDDACIADVVRTFNGLPHRTEAIAEIGGINWINDSKATNPGATEAALLGIDQPVILIAGGQGKGADFASLADAIADGVKAVVLLGEDAGLLAEALDPKVSTLFADSLADAVEAAAGVAADGDVVLLSPACASFDMFRGYADRGDQFRDIVLRLKGGHT